MLIGLASRTAISKPVRYNSRMVRSSTTELLAWRHSSWLLTAKCFGHAETPLLWMPRMRPAAMRPATIGSSE